MYYKESLVVKMINISYLQECLLCEVMIDNIRGCIALIYRSPSQNSLEFQHFLSGFEQLLINIEGFKPNFTVLLGDYNARSRSWWASDTNTPEGMQLDALTSSYGLQQLVNEPTHILPGSSSCIELIFTDQPSLVVSSGTHPSHHANYHHQFIYSKLNLKIEYPPPYQRLVWNFKKANITSIRKPILTLNWEFSFFNKRVHEQVSIFNNTLMNIFSNYISSKFVTIDDKDPPWMTERTRNKIFEKSYIYKSYISNGKTAIDYQKLHDIGSEISQMISKRKSIIMINSPKKLMILQLFLKHTGPY